MLLPSLRILISLLSSNINIIPSKQLTFPFFIPNSTQFWSFTVVLLQLKIRVFSDRGKHFSVRFNISLDNAHMENLVNWTHHFAFFLWKSNALNHIKEIMKKENGEKESLKEIPLLMSPFQTSHPRILLKTQFSRSTSSRMLAYWC